MYKSEECPGDKDSHFTCGSVCRDYSSSNGLLTTPYYPAPYPYDIDCIYTISQNNGTHIQFKFLKFDIYQNDYLEIRDGKTDESPLMGILYGYDVPTSIMSNQHNIWLR